MTKHHPVFYNFTPYAGSVDSGFQVDCLGVMTNCDFWAAAVPSPPTIKTDYPAVDDEYFEWIDLLESVVAAKEQYQMIELGAGFGRWSMRAARAVALYRPIPIRLTAVEAEPRHFCWLTQHFRHNNIDPDEHDLIQAVVSDSSGEALFYVGMPDDGKDRPDQWYGQRVAKSYEAIDRETHDDYEGFETIRLKSGWKSIRVRSLVLTEVMSKMDRVDLIDLDVQGEELKVITAAIRDIDKKVARLHIGTHGGEIEDGLRSLLTHDGWRCLADYTGMATNQTPWGPVKFEDGVQSWVNPRMT